MLEVNVKGNIGFIRALADSIGSTFENGIVKIPEDKGKGYVRGFLLGSSIGMMINDFESNTPMLARRKGDASSNEKILMLFNNIFHSKDDVSVSPSSKQLSKINDLPSVQIGKGKINIERLYPGKTRFRSIMIAIDTESLKKLLGPNEENVIYKKITLSNQPLLFEEMLSPQIQKVALEIIEGEVPESMYQFYYRVKAEELICLLFLELLKRENTTIHALNQNDVQLIYKIRAKILAHIDTPPILSDIALDAGMSESKLARSFKQIFGNSIFNYYQSFRMHEAARLLKENKLSVSEVGYQMGFSSLSHFTKKFEEHIGMKPKKYSLKA
jgi:AraC-like DNA-binding protein